MGEVSGYCGCGSEIESVSDAAKIANVVLIGAEGDELCLEKDSVESNMKPRFLADKRWVDEGCRFLQQDSESRRVHAPEVAKGVGDFRSWRSSAPE